MKIIVLTVISAVLTFYVYGQESGQESGYVYRVPEQVVLEEAGDYKGYEDEVIRTIDWLLQTPINFEPEKWKAAGRFLLQWLSGSPYVTVEINEETATFMQANPELMVVFVGGWTKYVLESGDKNKVMGTQKGIEAVIDFYTSYRDFLKEDKHVEKYIRMKEKGKLEKYIRKHA